MEGLTLGLISITLAQIHWDKGRDFLGGLYGALGVAFVFFSVIT